jgi:phosphonate transport system ATP-binding protein
VTYRGGVRALKGLTLDIPAGQFLVLVGLSGAGKSTLIRAINGLVPVSSGKVLVGDRDVAQASGRELRQIRAGIGLIFPGFNLV